MRLIDVNQDTLHIEEFWDESIPQYAILSHRWLTNEIVFQDIQSKGPIADEFKESYEKIKNCCKQAQRDGYQWLWVDTVCIDKSSSSELSEAINSMFQWYENAQICYVYLFDVPSESSSLTSRRKLESFFASVWWSRGWTLQELLAPKRVEFYDQEWRPRGSKSLLSSEISKFTRIKPSILRGEELLRTASVACRMSWASRRQTTRKEDQAYCLFGIFGVNMPLLYGEGETAFIRLQEEIIKDTDDESIFAWSRPTSSRTESRRSGWGILAKSPVYFANSGEIVPCKVWETPTPHAMTSKGLRIEIPVYRVSTGKTLAVLNCRSENDFHNILQIRIELPKGSDQATRSSLDIFKMPVADLWRLDLGSRIFGWIPKQTIYLSKHSESLTINRGVYRPRRNKFFLRTPIKQEQISVAGVYPRSFWSERMDMALGPDTVADVDSDESDKAKKLSKRILDTHDEPDADRLIINRPGSSSDYDTSESDESETDPSSDESHDHRHNRRDYHPLRKSPTPYADAEWPDWGPKSSTSSGRPEKLALVWDVEEVDMDGACEQDGSWRTWLVLNLPNHPRNQAVRVLVLLLHHLKGGKVTRADLFERHLTNPSAIKLIKSELLQPKGSPNNRGLLLSMRSFLFNSAKFLFKHLAQSIKRETFFSKRAEFLFTKTESFRKQVKYFLNQQSLIRSDYYATVKVTPERVMGKRMWVIDLNVSELPFNRWAVYFLSISGHLLILLICSIFIFGFQGLGLGLYRGLPLAFTSASCGLILLFPLLVNRFGTAVYTTPSVKQEFSSILLLKQAVSRNLRRDRTMTRARERHIIQNKTAIRVQKRMAFAWRVEVYVCLFICAFFVFR